MAEPTPIDIEIDKTIEGFYRMDNQSFIGKVRHLEQKYPELFEDQHWQTMVRRELDFRLLLRPTR